MVEARVREAAKLGFSSFVLPASNRKHLKDLDESLCKKITWIKDAQDLANLFQLDERRGVRGKTAATAAARDDRLAKERAAKDAAQGLDF